MADAPLPNPPDGTPIAAAFKGSDTGDWTAIRAETRDGYLFTPRYGPDRLPMIWNPEEWNGRIPRDQVNLAVTELFTQWKMARFYCNPSGWYTEIGEWALAHGPDVVVSWPIASIARMFPAIRRFETDLSTRIMHDGCKTTELHVANCRKIAKPGDKYLLGKPSEHQKIDAAIASIVAHEAAADARAAGWVDEADNRMFCY